MHTNEIKHRSRLQYHFIQSKYFYSPSPKRFDLYVVSLFQQSVPFSQELQEQIVYNITLLFVLIMLRSS
jgi:hypothetical protein